MTGADSSEQNTVTAYLVAAGQWHDIDFARLELLKLLAENERIRTTVAHDYADLQAIGNADFLISYTCNLRPTDEQQLALRDFVQGGKSWFALHGTNAIIEALADGRYACPATSPVLMQTLGTQFVAHPQYPSAPWPVTISDPEHPLVKGVGAFETDDELYLARIYGDLHLLLETEYSGMIPPGFTERDWTKDDPRRPVYYINRVGRGEVLYLTLGHCRGHYDMRSAGLAYYPRVERGSWQKPQFYELLRRGLKYCFDRALDAR